MARFAGLVPPYGNLRFRSEKCLFELEGQIFAQISTALHSCAPPPAGSATPEHVSESEKLSKDVAEVLKDRRIEASRLSATAAQPGVPEAVVGRALVDIGQHGIGFADFLEAFFRVGIIRISVGM